MSAELFAVIDAGDRSPVFDFDGTTLVFDSESDAAAFVADSPNPRLVIPASQLPEDAP